MVKPRGFIKLLGGEYDLMQKAGGTVLFKFYLSSIIILAIAIISFLSIVYAIELLFHVMIVEILLSLFLSSLFVLLFIFIVNTFTKDARQRRLINFSNITRLGFVMFIGFIVSKPIEAFLYRDAVAPDVKNYQGQLIEKHNQKIAQLFKHDIEKLTNEKDNYVRLNISGGFDRDILAITNQLTAIDQKKTDLATTSALRIGKGAYFFYRIKTISGKYPGAWLTTVVIVILFLAPVFLIYSISSDEEYFKRKNQQERKMVEKAYQAFCKKYEEIFLEKYGINLAYYSKYEDPPFNTLVKKPPVCKSANAFHERYAQP